jgi:hypothetical protein
MRTFPSRAARKRFCGRPCYAAWMAENLRGQLAPRHGVMHSPESLAKMRKAKAGSPRGSAAPGWKGGRHLARGYVMVSLSALASSEMALAEPMTNGSSNRAVPEHRLVMARMLGRPLLSSEHVHHINGRKADNRPENLTLSDSAAHKMEHHAILREMKSLRWQNEVLMRLLCECAERTSRLAG